MPSPARRRLALLLGPFLLILLGQALAEAQLSKAGVVTAVRGPAGRAGAASPEVAPLTFRDDVFIQDRILTGPGGSVGVLLAGKAFLTINELSDLTISQGRDRGVLKLVAGRIGLRVRSGPVPPGETLEVQTLNAIVTLQDGFIVLTAQATEAGPKSQLAAIEVTSPVSVCREADPAGCTHLDSQGIVSLSGIGAATTMSPVRPLSLEEDAELRKMARAPRNPEHTDRVPVELARRVVDEKLQEATHLAALLADLRGASSFAATDVAPGDAPVVPDLPAGPDSPSEAPSPTTIGVNESAVARAIPLVASAIPTTLNPASPPGPLVITAGTVDFSTGTPRLFSSLTLAGGTLTGSDRVTLLGPSTWTRGTMSGTGTTAVAAGGTLLLSGPGPHDLSQRTLATAGTVTWTGGAIRTGNGATITNSGLWDLQAAATLSNALGGSPSTFLNTGSLTKSAGGGTTTIAIAFDNSGTVQVQRGTLRLQGGGTSVSGALAAMAPATLRFNGGTFTISGGTVSGTGSVRVSGGTVDVTGGAWTVSGATDLSGGSLNFNSGAAASSAGGTFSGGTLGGTGTFTVGAGGGTYTWTRGTMSGTGTTAVAAGGTLLLSGPGPHDLSQRTLTTAGTVTWTGGAIRTGNGATITNSGLWDLQAAATLSNALGGSPSTFLNTGSLTKSAGGGTTTIAIAFDNSGTVQVQRGTLRLQGGGTSAGTFDTAAGTTLNFAGGTHNLGVGSGLTGGGTVTVTGGRVNLDGTYGLTGTTSVTGGSLAVTGDFVGIGAGTTLNPAGTMLAASGGAVSVAGNLIRVAPGGGIASGSAAPLVSFTRGTHSIATAAGTAMVNLAGSASAVDPESGLALGTDMPLQHAGNLVQASRGRVSGQRVLSMDTALLDASMPLVSVGTNSTLTTSQAAVNLGNQAHVKMTASDLIQLAGGTLRVNQGSLVDVAGGSKLAVNGNFLTMSGRATLTVSSGALLNLQDNSFVRIDGALVNFLGTRNRINITNSFCPCQDFAGIRVALTGGASPANVSITNPIKNPAGGTLNYSSPNAAAIVVNGAGSTLTISGQ